MTKQGKVKYPLHIREVYFGLNCFLQMLQHIYEIHYSVSFPQVTNPIWTKYIKLWLGCIFYIACSGTQTNHMQYFERRCVNVSINQKKMTFRLINNQRIMNRNLYKFGTLSHISSTAGPDPHELQQRWKWTFLNPYDLLKWKWQEKIISINGLKSYLLTSTAHSPNIGPKGLCWLAGNF